MKKVYERYGLALRVQCLTLFEVGIPLPIICNKYNVTKSAVYRWRRIAKSRGYDPDKDPRILMSYVEDAPRSGRPTVCTWERTQQLVAEVTGSKAGRNMTCKELGQKLGVSAKSVYRILQREQFKSCKESTKPGLTEAIIKARLAFCKVYKDWTLEDWKNIIWTDETSVTLGCRRGKYRIWRRKHKHFLKTCIRSRWKGASEFI
jgi:transposase